MYNYLWQGSGDGSTGRFSLVFFFHELSWFLPRSHPSLRSVRGPLWSIQRRIWWNYSIVSEMPAITRCWHYPILSGGLYWVMNAKSCDPEKFFFIFMNFFLGGLFCCHWSFLVNSFPSANLDCPDIHHRLPSMYSHIYTFKNTRLKTHIWIHSSLAHWEVTPKDVKAVWWGRFCMMNCAATLFVLTFSRFHGNSVGIHLVLS